MAWRPPQSLRFLNRKEHKERREAPEWRLPIAVPEILAVISRACRLRARGRRNPKERWERKKEGRPRAAAFLS